MKTKKKYSWIFRYYNVMKGEVTYRTYLDLTVDDAKSLANEFTKENKDYYVSVYKLYKKF